MNRFILSTRKTAQTATAAPLGRLVATTALLLVSVAGVAVNQGVTPFDDLAAAGPTHDDPWKASATVAGTDDPWSVRAGGLLRDDPWKATVRGTGTDDPWKATAEGPGTDDPWKVSATGAGADDPWM
ncbi:hypothetical protein [Streptomyces sp. H27-H5]|uniref:hypothetical protein n=1 Tax=Streptomyces sp. H27-H5 TaxID=2996460 RepID=UPI00226E5AEB|nr:hypothetical protein [Streptomyces sp. H27-H5]MCY0963145.1 hypothetical protein [Streptomyces sp. H27-H5]